MHKKDVEEKLRKNNHIRYTNTKSIETFEDAVYNIPLVRHIIVDRGGSDKDCIVALAREIKLLWQELIELKCIAPRKIRISEDKVMIWRCPEEFIPEDDSCFKGFNKENKK